MRCPAAKKLINDYIDGDLSRSQETALESHLEICPDCQGLLRDFQKIRRDARELPPVAPSPLTWQKILAGVREAGPEAPSSQKERKGWFSLIRMPAGLRYALAAALALVIIGGGLIVGLKIKRGGGEEGYTLAKLKEAQHHYVLAIKALNEAIEAQKNGVDPQLAEVFKRNLQDIDRAIQACEQVVEKDPNNLAARAYLLTVYREKVTFLDEIMGAKKASAEKRAGVTL
jgi:tetratricopeptide (TPR) repeat protein